MPRKCQRFLGCVLDVKHHAILTTCYAAGLRISGAVQLKPTGIDSQRMVIRVEQGEGQKDRYVMLSPKLLEILRDYWKLRRPKAWLFLGDRAGQPITRGAVDRPARKDATCPACPNRSRRTVCGKPNCAGPPRSAGMSKHAINAATGASPSTAAATGIARCQSLARAQWLEDRRAELLDTQYFHVVFTLPGDIAAIAYHNKALMSLGT